MFSKITDIVRNNQDYWRENKSLQQKYNKERMQILSSVFTLFSRTRKVVRWTKK